jgi:hypothetical protein
MGITTIVIELSDRYAPTMAEHVSVPQRYARTQVLYIFSALHHHIITSTPVPQPNTYRGELLNVQYRAGVCRDAGCQGDCFRCFFNV